MLEHFNTWGTVIAGGLVALMICAPFIAGAFLTHIIVYALIFSIFALGYNIAFGYTGLISLAHSVFFGFAAYTVGIFTKSVGISSNPLILFCAAMAVGAILGIIIGFFSSFMRGIYVVLITLIFAEVAYLVIWVDPGGITWGESGIVGLRPSPIQMGVITVDLFKGKGLYELTLGIFVVCFLTIRVIINSQICEVFKGIRENEERVSSLGYNVRQYKILSFVLSAVFSSIAGVLMAFLDNTATAQLVHWLVGAEVLLITVLGGPGTLVGPVIGAFLVIFGKFYITAWIGGANWIYVLGGMYILVMMFLRGGIFGTRFGGFLTRLGQRKIIGYGT
jgi:branched-chain amino acid transport system permease protein